jgi:hypothetical protein
LKEIPGSLGSGRFFSVAKIEGGEKMSGGRGPPDLCRCIKNNEFITTKDVIVQRKQSESGIDNSLKKNDFILRVNEKLFSKFLIKLIINNEEVNKLKVYATKMIDDLLTRNIRSESDIDEALGLEAELQENTSKTQTSGKGLSRRAFMISALAGALLIGSGINPSIAKAEYRPEYGQMQLFQQYALALYMFQRNGDIDLNNKVISVATNSRGDPILYQQGTPVELILERVEEVDKETGEKKVYHTLNVGTNSRRDPRLYQVGTPAQLILGLNESSEWKKTDTELKKTDTEWKKTDTELKKTDTEWKKINTRIKSGGKPINKLTIATNSRGDPSIYQIGTPAQYIIKNNTITVATNSRGDPSIYQIGTPAQYIIKNNTITVATNSRGDPSIYQIGTPAQLIISDLK